MAIDAMITPPLPLSDGDDPSTHTVSAIIHHQKYERKKFYGWSINNEHSFVYGEQIIAALNNNSTILLPFMVDPAPHGGIGPLASHFLFGTTSDPSPPPLTFWWQIPQQAYNNTISDTSPSTILLNADKSWHQNSAHLPFGETYHSWFTSTWAHQILGANINTAFTEHLYSSNVHRPKLKKSPTYANEYPLAIGRDTRSFIHSTTQKQGDHSRVGTRHNPDDLCYSSSTACFFIGLYLERYIT
jgi:hypothetical protein